MIFNRGKRQTLSIRENILIAKQSPHFPRPVLSHINNKTHIFLALLSMYTSRTSVACKGSLKHFQKFSGGISQTQSLTTVPLPLPRIPRISTSAVGYSWHCHALTMPQLDRSQQQSEEKCLSLRFVWHSTSVPSSPTYISVLHPSLDKQPSVLIDFLIPIGFDLIQQGPKTSP